LLTPAHHAVGGACLYRGEFIRARASLAESLALYQPQHQVLTPLYGSLNPKVASLVLMAWTLCFLGYPEQALRRSYETLDLALMYVGIEKVFSQIIADPELQEYCWGRRVVPVSPNTLWATLSCFAMAFQRVQIEQEARGIVAVLGEFLKEIDALERELDKLRDHLRNAQNLLDDKVRPKLARVRRALEKPAAERVPEKVP